MHIFKYLEIQAVKEDRKRGVLTDQEYRRSTYRTAAAAGSPASGTAGAHLADLRLAGNGAACNEDARKKRHTADSGYGSEQPLDKRWSQEFTQEVSEFRCASQAWLLVNVLLLLYSFKSQIHTRFSLHSSNKC